jgi:hypothetical protein
MSEVIHPHIEDVTSFIAHFIRNHRPRDHSSYGYDFYLPYIMAAYIKDVEKSAAHPSDIPTPQTYIMEIEREQFPQYFTKHAGNYAA